MRLSAASILLPALSLAASSPKWPNGDAVDSLTDAQGAITTTPPAANASPSPSLEDLWLPITTIVVDAHQQEELKREVVQGAAVAQPTQVSQVSPITTYSEWHVINGVAQQVQVVYTQLFSAVPDQWPAPSSGSIGLGTIQGTVGVTKSKREAAPTAGAAVRRRQSNSATVGSGNTGAGSILAFAVAVVAALIAF